MRGKFILFIVIVGLIFIWLIWDIFSGLPDDETILHYFPESTVDSFYGFDWNKKIIRPVRKYVSLNRISDNLKKPVIISEDDTFFRHSGINLNELKNAFRENLKKKRFARGASTITMQVARNAFLHKKKTIMRKIQEIVLTKRIEARWDKRKILEYYLNIAEWGPNIYGAEAAAHYYFNKPCSQLSLAEGSLLAAILPNPIYYNPFKNFSGARKKQRRVLRLMREAGLIDKTQMDKILNTPIKLRKYGEKLEKPLHREYSIFDSLLGSPRIPDSLKVYADSLGIIFLPEDKND